MGFFGDLFKPQKKVIKKTEEEIANEKRIKWINEKTKQLKEEIIALAKKENGESFDFDKLEKGLKVGEYLISGKITQDKKRIYIFNERENVKTDFFNNLEDENYNESIENIAKYAFPSRILSFEIDLKSYFEINAKMEKNRSKITEKIAKIKREAKFKDRLENLSLSILEYKKHEVVTYSKEINSYFEEDTEELTQIKNITKNRVREILLVRNKLTKILITEEIEFLNNNLKIYLNSKKYFEFNKNFENYLNSEKDFEFNYMTDIILQGITRKIFKTILEELNEKVILLGNGKEKKEATVYDVVLNSKEYFYKNANYLKIEEKHYVEKLEKQKKNKAEYQNFIRGY